MDHAARLWELIEQRTRRDADRVAIDQQIWDRFGDERAIMFTDLAGFSRQVARFGIIHFLQVIFEQKRLFLPIVESHGGRLLKTEADSFMILFETAKGALTCALEMQRACQSVNVGREDEEHVVLCVGIGHGRLLKIGDDDVFGHEVNLASKLGEDIARPNEILVTQSARKVIGDIPEVTWEPVTGQFAGETECWRAAYTLANNR
jgi:class 3 adenylate cyclase